MSQGGCVSSASPRLLYTNISRTAQVCRRPAPQRLGLRWRHQMFPRQLRKLRARDLNYSAVCAGAARRLSTCEKGSEPVLSYLVEKDNHNGKTTDGHRVHLVNAAAGAAPGRTARAESPRQMIIRAPAGGAARRRPPRIRCPLCEPSESKCSPPLIDTRNFKRVTRALPTLWEGIKYLMVGYQVKGEMGVDNRNFHSLGVKQQQKFLLHFRIFLRARRSDATGSGLRGDRMTRVSDDGDVRLSAVTTRHPNELDV
ncbi:hypothetical protein EVAR_97412_1 [Eumeta japonica]|uniref:Uncharacterized protein n=1 Tax=Eumeta variegata TaxID=151549 RepID=A0A4C1WX99_EUMVA|nr:hypothetical protein EVAR_97412_1 [Eumeta japonica]